MRPVWQRASHRKSAGCTAGLLDSCCGWHAVTCVYYYVYYTCWWGEAFVAGAASCPSSQRLVKAVLRHRLLQADHCIWTGSKV